MKKETERRKKGDIKNGKGERGNHKKVRKKQQVKATKKTIKKGNKKAEIKTSKSVKNGRRSC